MDTECGFTAHFHGIKMWIYGKLKCGSSLVILISLWYDLK